MSKPLQVQSMRLRPSQMLPRDVLVLASIATPIVLWIVALFIYETESTDFESKWIVLLLAIADTVFAAVVLRWRYGIYESLLLNGFETRATITKITGFGDQRQIEYSFRYQAETIRSTSKMGGFIPMRRIKEEIGLEVPILVDPSKPTRFLVLDEVRA